MRSGEHMSSASRQQSQSLCAAVIALFRAAPAPWFVWWRATTSVRQNWCVAKRCCQADARSTVWSVEASSRTTHSIGECQSWHNTDSRAWSMVRAALYAGMTTLTRVTASPCASAIVPSVCPNGYTNGTFCCARSPLLGSFVRRSGCDLGHKDARRWRALAYALFSEQAAAPSPFE